LINLASVASDGREPFIFARIFAARRAHSAMLMPLSWFHGSDYRAEIAAA
jgi:hypothetical protein